MRTRQLFYVMAAALLAAWVCAPAQADVLSFDYRPVEITFAAGTPTTSGLYDPIDVYTLPAAAGLRPGIGIAWLDPLVPVYEHSATQEAHNTVSAAFPEADGWSYTSRVAELADNSLVVHTYDVQGTTARVGCQFHLEYVHHAGNPADVHWIQVITTNHQHPGAHGPVVTYVDNPFSPRRRLPYYDDGGAATNDAFYDFPGRTDTARSHFWTAELTVVTGPATPADPADNPVPGEIQYVASVTWGWRNVAFRPNPLCFLLPGWGNNDGVQGNFDAQDGSLSFGSYQIDELTGGGDYTGDLWMGATVTLPTFTIDTDWDEEGFLFTSEGGQLLVENGGQTLLSCDMDYLIINDDCPELTFDLWALMRNVDVNTDLGSSFASDLQAAMDENPGLPPELFGLCPAGIGNATNGFQDSGEFTLDAFIGGQCDEIPEPGALVLLAFGACLLCRRASRRGLTPFRRKDG